ncbi:MAG TPA: carbohydrate kinase [Anaerovoracaceae bacterium]|nr:carbohydrate kinase [Anaerovoracaceae bacterium]
MPNIDIVAFGELLIDYTPAGKSPSGMDLFEQNPGGAPANVLACASRLGQRTAFIGKIGADMQGEFLRKTLQDAGVNTGGLVSDENCFTTLAFVSLKENGERSFAFARKPGADTRIYREDVDLSVIRNSRIFHFGSLSLTDSPARETTFFALEEAKKANCIISYDPNYRPLLWKSREQAKEQMCAALPYADMIKLSEEEAELITGHADPRAAAEHLTGCGIGIAAVTLGSNGAVIATKDGCDTVPGFAVDAVDTTGAGDAFWGAFLSGFAEFGGRPEEISLTKACGMARFANAAAALCVTKRGGIPAMPQPDEIRRLLER